jgi:hypothetical protein
LEGIQSALVASPVHASASRGPRFAAFAAKTALEGAIREKARKMKAATVRALRCALACAHAVSMLRVVCVCVNVCVHAWACSCGVRCFVYVFLVLYS